MTHEDALNLILAQACSYEETPEGTVYYIELHCAEMKIVARPLGNLKFEVLSCEKVKEEESEESEEQAPYFVSPPCPEDCEHLGPECALSCYED